MLFRIRGVLIPILIKTPSFLFEHVQARAKIPEMRAIGGSGCKGARED